MRGLLGDRFLRRFAGNLKHRGNHPASQVIEQKPGVETDGTPRLDIAAEQVHEIEAADSKEKPNGEEQNNKKE